MELVGLHYSPWSEKARWALDHRGVAYDYAEFLPMLGELPLRARAGKMRGKITVPILFDGDQVLGDSYAIAQHADRAAAGSRVLPSLFPEAHEAAIRAWNTKSEAALAAARARVLRELAGDRHALAESLPTFVPHALRSASAGVAGMAVRFLAKKHYATDVDSAATSKEVDAVLNELRAALGGKPYLLGAFSYADIAMAVVLQMVVPVDARFIRLGEATRRCWTEPELARKHADLVAWRDELYAKHRAA